MNANHTTPPGQTTGTPTADDYDFTPKPPPDRSNRDRAIGLVTDEQPNGSLKSAVSSQARTIPGIAPGPTWYRNQILEPVRPVSGKTASRRNRRFTNEAQVCRGMKDMMADPTGDVFASEDTGLTPNGRRMVVVDEDFYAETRPRNWPPQPIRKGAGKGPRQHNQSPRIRC